MMGVWNKLESKGDKNPSTRNGFPSLLFVTGVGVGGVATVDLLVCRIHFHHEGIVTPPVDSCTVNTVRKKAWVNRGYRVVSCRVYSLSHRQRPQGPLGKKKKKKDQHREVDKPSIDVQRQTWQRSRKKKAEE